jgi:hypothetical protein
MLCARCDQHVAFSEIDRATNSSSVVQSPQIWCKNPACPAFEVCADVPIETYGSSQHRKRLPEAKRKPAPATDEVELDPGSAT